MPISLRNRRVILAGRAAIRYLLLARFSQDIAAPLPGLLPVDVGEPLIVVDTTNLASISAGQVSFAGRVGAGDPGVRGPSMARIIGRTVLAQMTLPGTSVRGTVGWDTNQSGSHGSYAMTFGTGGGIDLVTPAITAIILYTATTYDTAIVLRATGAFWFIKGGAFTNWTLVWVDNSGVIAPLYPAVVVTNTTGVFTCDNFRVVDLGLYDARFASDYGLATNRLVSPAAGATTVSTADALIEVSCTYSAGVNFDIAFRQQDTSNLWWIRGGADTNLYLYEKVAGTDTQRASSAAAFPAGTHRVVIVQEGMTIKIYVDNVLKITYSSASNFQSATTVRVMSLGGGVSELVCWPRTISLRGDL